MWTKSPLLLGSGMGEENLVVVVVVVAVVVVGAVVASGPFLSSD